MTWEDHRRSRVLAEQFKCKYKPLTLEASRYIRYPALAALTLALLVRERPKYLFCQNPSVVLAALCVLLKPLFRYRLIVDRHSNFKFETADSKALKARIFHAVSNFSIRNADLNIITNHVLADIVEQTGGRAVVLPDKIPQLDSSKPAPNFFSLSDTAKVVCITMFDDDEPIQELVQAGVGLGDRATLFMTGNYRKTYSEAEKEALEEKGVHFCGFVDEETYASALANADAVVVLTKKDLILNCGAYEALSLAKPLVLSDTPTLQQYFGGCAVYADPRNPRSIIDSIIKALNCRDQLSYKAKTSVEILDREWNIQFSRVCESAGII
ncbi:glycosyltransferase [Vreelandella utahensis]|uniref:glycosyltransferase n=1 Tax=Vreelandella halophila TaxID=86177 RepID=UPI00117B3AE7|nr:glycosyltransferase [Halomonas utahensis]